MREDLKQENAECEKVLESSDLRQQTTEDAWSEFRLQRFFRSHHSSSRSPAALATAIEKHERDVFVAHTQKLVVWHKLRKIEEDERNDLKSSLDALCRLGEQAEYAEAGGSSGGRFGVPKEEGLRGINAAAWQLPAVLTSEAVKDMLLAFSFSRVPLHVSSFRRILRMVKPVLEQQVSSVTFIPSGRRVTVVGDLHGKLRDLEKILEINGWPQEDNVYVFNGDFVDRGPHSLEIISILFALKVVFPDFVHLNRGNHEDVNIARANGFFEEVAAKYCSADLYMQICDIFSLLPLCTVVEDLAFIVHGGLPREENVTIEDIAAVPRHKFRSTVSDMWWWEGTDDVDRTRRWRRSPKSVTVVEDLLWGDPHQVFDDTDTAGCYLPNFSRGGGTSFGKQCVQRFLQREGLRVMVRSHQCVPQGVQVFDCGNGTSLYTIFSSSGYDGTDNDGAVLRLSANRSRAPFPIIFAAEDDQGIECHTKQYLVDQICSHKGQLHDELKTMAWARDARGMVSVEEWNRALQKCLKLNIDFRPLRLELEGGVSGLVDVEAFLSRYGVEMVLPNGEAVAVADSELQAAALFENRKKLTTILRLLDSNHDGRLSLDEVVRGCELLNQSRPKHKHINGTLLFQRLDTDGGGFVSVEELCESWRFTHAPPGDATLRQGPVLPTTPGLHARIVSVVRMVSERVFGTSGKRISL